MAMKAIPQSTPQAKLQSTPQSFKIVLFEVRQNFFMAAMFFCFSFSFGFLSVMAIEQIQKINDMIKSVDWSADLAIVPKGVSLTDLQHELESGKSDALLPLAIYETTSGLAKGQFQLSAVLATSENEKPFLSYLGEQGLGWAWLEKNISSRPYGDQNKYSTAEWGTKVISAFFAKGSPTAMASLKDLIDRRTVAQAIWIESAAKRDREAKANLQSSLGFLIFILAVLFGFGFLSSGRWIFEKLKQTFLVLNEIGYSLAERNQIALLYFLLILILPFAIGAVLQLQMGIFIFDKSR